MRRAVIVASVAMFILSASLAGGAVAYARTPTRTATPTPSPTPTATPTINPASLGSRPAEFIVWLWVDGHRSSEPIVPKVGDVVCGEDGGPVSVTESGDEQQLVYVETAPKVPGCATEGSTITFFVDGRQANQTWRYHREPNVWVRFLVLTVGPSFARVGGYFSWPDQLPILNGSEDDSKSVLIPYIDGRACGYDWVLAPEGGHRYVVVVYSSEQRAGCGYEGAPITFRLVDGQGNVLATAEEKGVWHAWDGTDATAEQLNLTLVTPRGIRIGSMGTGGSDARSTPSDAVLGLALAGVAALATGVVLRRRANPS